jgi:hypothetical protein
MNNRHKERYKPRTLRLPPRRLNLVLIRQPEIDACDISPVLAQMQPYIDNPQPHHARSVGFILDTKHGPDTPVYTLPEVRAYFKKLDAAFPYLLYFSPPDLMYLQTIVFSLIDDYTVIESPEGVEFEYNSEVVREYIWSRCDAILAGYTVSYKIQGGPRDPQNKEIVQIIDKHLEDMMDAFKIRWKNKK